MQDLTPSFDPGSALAPVDARPAIAAQPLGASAPHPWLVGLAAQLQQRGWNVQREADGSLRLPLPSTPELAPPQPVAAHGLTPADLLAERGWFTRWDASGNLLLTAQGRQRGAGV